MKKKRLIIVLAILLAVFAIAVFVDPTYVLLGLLRNESFYQGRPTTYWSREIQRLRPVAPSAGFFVYLDKFFDYFRSSDPVSREDLTLLKGGPEAAPVLKELLRDKEPFVRWTAAFALINAGDVQTREVVPGLCDALLYTERTFSPKQSDFWSEDEFIRYHAMLTLDEMGLEPELKAAIPALIFELGDDLYEQHGEWAPDYVASRAERILSRIGEPAVPALIQALKNPKPEIRVNAIHVLGDMGLEEARDAVPALWDALDNRSTCLAAAQALWKLDAETDAVVPPVLAALKESDEKAAEILGEMGMQAEDVIAALLHALHDEDRLVRCNAAVAIGQFGPQARPKTDPGSTEVVGALIVALKDEDSSVRWDAAWALGQLGPEAGPAVPALVETLTDSDGHIAGTAATSLGQIGPAARSVIPALIRVLEEPKKANSFPSTRDCAASALRAIGNKDPAEAKALVAAWSEKHSQDYATEALVALGPAAVPALITALGDQDAHIRKNAARTLGRIGPPAKAAVPALTEGLRGSDKDMRWVAAEAIAKIGPDARSAIPALRVNLQDRELWASGLRPLESGPRVK